MPRHAGLMLPLFSAPSASSWGLGEFPDLVPLASWAKSRGFDRVMLLPVGTVPDGVRSPYSAMTAMAIDPIYLALERVDDFTRAGGLDALSASTHADIAAARASTSVQYEAIRRAKTEALQVAFDRFVADEWEALTLRAAALAGYIARERWWLDDYALYQAIAHATGQPSWRDWPEPLRDRDHGAVDHARRQLAREILQQQYWQWLAEAQWQEARRGAHERGVMIVGDLPFMVNANSPDVWVRPREYFFDVSLGVPPDAFSATGQDWNLPTYNWAAIAATGYAWIQDRARRMAALFDAYRVDHLVGLYRTFGRPLNGGDAFFNPPDEGDQIRQGEHILSLLRSAGAGILAEDLGVVPDFVRASLERLGVPGSKVLRWERAWHQLGQPFVDPKEYPRVSAAMTGTHDTETLAEWWESTSADERAAFAGMLRKGGYGAIGADAAWSDLVRDAILAAAFAAQSEELFLPIQDVFGWRDRINVPGTVAENNWTWKIPMSGIDSYDSPLPRREL